MLLNARIALSTPSVLLVPYTQHHVPLYHKWMQDPALRAATASEPLTLHEEYAMRTSWRADHDKLTFIVCLPLQDPQGGAAGTVRAAEDDGEARMVGDINLFLFAADDDENDTSNTKDDPKSRGVVGELELMIATPIHQGRGLGRAAVVAFVSYVLENWSAIAAEYRYSDRTIPKETSKPLARLEYLRAKIHETNSRSISLFQSLGFEGQGDANYFGEIELRWHGGVEEVRRMRGWEEVRVLEYQRIQGWRCQGTLSDFPLN